MVLGLNCVRVRQYTKSDLFLIDNEENFPNIENIFYVTPLI